MKKDLLHKFLLSIVAVLFLLNFMYGIFSSGTAEAVKEHGEIGRYQIAAWSAQSGTRLHHSGYYIVDTISGKVVSSKSEVHSYKE